MNGNVIKVRKQFKESSILFQSDSKCAVENAIDTVLRHRLELDRFIISNPMFLKALEPIDIDDDAPRVVKIMSAVADAVGVGPMAVVAGALADLALETMLTSKAEIAIVEDGGEIAASSKKEFNIGLYAGKTPLSKLIGFKINPLDCPIGVATSSATVGHALSFGKADSVTVFADTAALADGAATAICNAVKGKDVEKSIQVGLKHAETLQTIRGTIITREDCIGTFGKLPQLVKIESELDLSKVALLEKSSIKTLI
ncbi:UPF0280 family protein [Candidatus Bathyarchaeota archaeon]|nr:UPF0280 family protein [Candidatus Bathyarchaeota archaeon]